MDASRTALHGLMDIFVSPGQALALAREKPGSFWVPFAAVVLSVTGMTVWYYATVDIDWVVDTLLSAQGVEMPADQREAAAPYMTREFYMGSSVVGVLLVLAVMYALLATWFLVAARVRGDEQHGYMQWLSLVSWANAPALLAAFAQAVAWLTADSNRIIFQDLQVTTLNQLVFRFPLGHEWYQFAQSINLFLFWTIGLLFFGIRRWTEMTPGGALALAASPYTIAYGVWAVIKLAF